MTELSEIKKVIHQKNSGFDGSICLSTIEKSLNEVASKIQLKVSENYRINHVLHVMTEAYFTGGHTKVVERWIRLDKKRIHSVFFTKSSAYVPQDITIAVNRSGGGIINHDIIGDIQVATQLRDVASHFQYIVLHVNPDDIIPHLAFGTNDFTRPILMFNHADHLFGLSFSISDLIAETKTWGLRLTKKHRGITRSSVLGIPPLEYSTIDEKVNDTVCRVKFDAANLENYAVLTGGVHKFKSNNKIFETCLLSTFEDIKEFKLIVVGMKKYVFFTEFYNLGKYRNRIIFVGQLPENNFLRLLKGASLFINSYPMGGDTALQSAIQLGCPTLTLKCVTGLPDFSYSNTMIVDDARSFSLKSNELFHQTKTNQVEQLKLYAETECNLFLENLEKIYNSLPRHHEIKYSVASSIEKKTSLYEVLRLFYNRQRILSRIGRLALMKKRENGIIKLFFRLLG